MDINQLTAEQFTRIIKLVDGGALADVHVGTVQLDTSFEWEHFAKLLGFVDSLEYIIDTDFGASDYRPWSHKAHRWYTVNGGSIEQHDDGTIGVLWFNPGHPVRTRLFHDWDDMRGHRELFPLIEYKETTDNV